MSNVDFDSGVVQFLRGSLTCDALSKAAIHHMTGRVFAPRDVNTAGRVIKSEIRYIPYYRFVGQYEAKWTATFEFKRIEQRQEWERRRITFKHGKQQHENVPVIKTRMTWDKIPSSGEAIGEFDLREYAGSEFTPAKRRKLTDFLAQAPVIRETDALPDGEVSNESCNVRPQDVFANYIKPQLDKIIDNAVKQHAQGDRQSNWHFTASYDNLTATIIAIPVGHAVFEYRGQKYNYWVSAVDPQRVIADKGPVDKETRLREIMAFLTLGLWLLTPTPQKKEGKAQATDTVNPQDKAPPPPLRKPPSHLHPKKNPRLRRRKRSRWPQSLNRMVDFYAEHPIPQLK